MDSIQQDFRDIAIAHVIADLLAAEARIASFVDDVETYRALAQQAIHALHGLTVERDRLRDQHHRLRDEYRALREHLLQTVAA
jgi:hypothetical protein